MTSPLIEVENINVRYGPTPVLENISLSVEASTYLGIVGPNGSGKTTLIKSLLGLTDTDSGDIRLFGTPLSCFKQWNRVGYLPQVSKSLHQGFPANVREIVASGLLSCKGIFKRINKEDRQKVDEILEELQISKIAGRMIGKLSGGQQQRVFLARAMVSQPEVLILDEPTVALDPETRTRFYETLKRLNVEKGVTVLLVTHDSGTIGQFASSLLYLDRSVIFHGSFENFCHSPKMEKYFGEYSQHLICHQH